MPILVLAMAASGWARERSLQTIEWLYARPLSSDRIFAVRAIAIAIPSLGMAVACPLAIIASGLAARDSRLPELLVFAVVLTAFCIGLFRYALGLSVPVAPWLLGY